MSVRSVGVSQLLSLQRSTFNRILGSIKKYLKGDYTSEDFASKLDGSFSSGHSHSSKGERVEKQNLHNIDEALDEEDVNRTPKKDQ